MRGQRGVAPAHKRIRLRGDWSDTGPESRPEDQVVEEEEQGGGGERGNLMNRMSRLFERWMDMALDSVSGDEGEEGEEGEVGSGEVREEEREREGGSSEVEEMNRHENDPNLDHRSSDSSSRWTPCESASEGAADDTSTPNHGESDRDSGVMDQATPESDLQMAQDVAERSLVNVVQEAVHQAMNDSLSWSLEEEEEESEEVVNSPDHPEMIIAGGPSDNPVGNSSGAQRDAQHLSTPMDTARSSSSAPIDTERTCLGSKATSTDAVGSEATPTNTARTGESDPLESYSGELNPLPSDALSSQINLSVPTSPLLANVRETSSPTSSSPSSVAGGRRSHDRSPDHSYRRSRFRAQRKRGERSRGVPGEGEVGEKGEGGGEEGRRRNPLCESCTQLQPFMVYKGHRNSRTMVLYLHTVFVYKS